MQIATYSLPYDTYCHYRYRYPTDTKRRYVCDTALVKYLSDEWHNHFSSTLRRSPFDWEHVRYLRPLHSRQIKLVAALSYGTPYNLKLPLALLVCDDTFYV